MFTKINILSIVQNNHQTFMDSNNSPLYLDWILFYFIPILIGIIVSLNNPSHLLILLQAMFGIVIFIKSWFLLIHISNNKIWNINDSIDSMILGIFRREIITHIQYHLIVSLSLIILGVIYFIIGCGIMLIMMMFIHMVLVELMIIKRMYIFYNQILM